jgi:hypothetical protein
MLKLTLKITFIAIISMVVSCFGRNRGNSPDLQLYQQLSYLMLAQLDSESRSLKFEVTAKDSINLFKEVETFPKFVFFHSELNCNSCVEENLVFVNDFCDSIGEEHVLFLASYKNKRDLHIFKRINKIVSPIYNVSSLGLPIEELNLPFCFVVNENRKAECVFIPLKEDNSQFKRYLKMIKKKYFS